MCSVGVEEAVTVVATETEEDSKTDVTSAEMFHPRDEDIETWMDRAFDMVSLTGSDSVVCFIHK